MGDAGPLRVVAALIERDGRVLVTQRRIDDRTWPLRWEFPGGKVDPGEGDAEALRREMKEELAVTVDVGELFVAVQDRTPSGRELDFRVYRCALRSGQPRCVEVADIAWVDLATLASLPMPPADGPVVAALLRS